MLITLARKPIPKGGTVVQTCLTYGTGSLNIDASRIGTGTGEVTTVTVPDHRSGNYGQDTAAYKDRAKLTIQRVDQGRWPANLLLYGGGLAAGFPESNSPRSGGNPNLPTLKLGTSCFGNGKETGRSFTDYKDIGSAARFFKHIGKDNTP